MDGCWIAMASPTRSSDTNFVPFPYTTVPKKDYKQVHHITSAYNTPRSWFGIGGDAVDFFNWNRFHNGRLCILFLLLVTFLWPTNLTLSPSEPTSFLTHRSSVSIFQYLNWHRDHSCLKLTHQESIAVEKEKEWLPIEKYVLGFSFAWPSFMLIVVSSSRVNCTFGYIARIYQHFCSSLHSIATAWSGMWSSTTIKSLPPKLTSTLQITHQPKKKLFHDGIELL